MNTNIIRIIFRVAKLPKKFNPFEWRAEKSKVSFQKYGSQEHLLVHNKKEIKFYTTILHFLPNFKVILKISTYSKPLNIRQLLPDLCVAFNEFISGIFLKLVLIVNTSKMSKP